MDQKAMSYGLRIKLHHENALRATTVARILRGIQLLRTGSTMDAEIVARLNRHYLRPGIWLPRLFVGRRVSTADLLNRTVQQLRKESPELDSIWSHDLVSMASASVEAALPDSGLSLIGIAEGSMESVIADAVESAIEGIRSLFEWLRSGTSAPRAHQDVARFVATLPDGGGAMTVKRSATELGATQIAATVLEMRTTKIEVERVSPADVHARIEIRRGNRGSPSPVNILTP